MAPSLLFDREAGRADMRPDMSAYDRPRQVSLDGFCSINGSPDVACSMVGLSLERGTLVSAADVAFGDAVVLALPHLGLQKGAVARIFGGGFEIQLSRAAYERLVTYIDWIAGGAGGGEARRHERIVPIRKLVALDRPGEPPSMARIVDLSRSGAAFTTSRILSPGERVTLGRMAARIVRTFDGGAAAVFDELIAEESFDAMIDLAA